MLKTVGWIILALLGVFVIMRLMRSSSSTPATKPQADGWMLLWSGLGAAIGGAMSGSRSSKPRAETIYSGVGNPLPSMSGDAAALKGWTDQGAYTDRVTYGQPGPSSQGSAYEDPFASLTAEDVAASDDGESV